MVSLLAADGGPVRRAVFHEWTMWSRTPDYRLDQALPIASAGMVLRHMGVDRAAITTPYSEAAFDSLGPSRGLVLYRDGAQQFSGLVTEQTLEWDAQNGRALISVEAESDEAHLADRPVFPDPLRAADDQTVNDYWTYTGAASTAMRQLISDQAGPTCRADRRVPGLVLGFNPGAGVSRKWTGLFSPFVLDQLTLMSVASGANLGIRTSTTTGTLTVDVTQPRDLAQSVRFSVEFGNLAGVTYRVAVPTVTNALAAGQGDLHLRLRRKANTTDPLATAWGRQRWAYIDRRDTADAAELVTAAQDALADGGPTQSLAVTLLDSQAATYGQDWGLGDRIAVYVKVPGQVGNAVTVSDVVREILITVSETGAESIRPAIGSYDAKAVIPTPTQKKLAAVGQGLSGLIARK